MKYLLALCALFITTSCCADVITCYSQGKVIYHGIVKDVSYVEGMMIFKEPKSGKIVFVSADCIVTMKV